MKNASAIGLILLLGGCSLINSLDAVKGQVTAEAGAGGGKGTGGSKATGGSGGALTDAANGGTTDFDAASGGTTGSGGKKSGSGGSTADANSDVFVPGGPGGAIVSYQYNATTKKAVVWVLDPLDGSQIAQEASPALLAIAQDPSNDLWYFFQQPAVPTDPAKLQVRQLSVKTGKFHDVGTPVLAPIPASGLGVLNGRVAYLSKPSVSDTDQTTYSLTVLNTVNPAAIKVVADKQAIAVTGSQLGLTANPNGGATIGGSITLAIQDATCTSSCNVSLLRVTVDAQNVQQDQAAVIVGQVATGGGQAGIAYDSAGKADVVILPPTDITGQPNGCALNPTSLGTITKYSTSSSHTSLTTPVSFSVGATRISGSAFDSCSDLAFATTLSNSDQAVWAIPATTGTPKKLCQTEGGAGLLYEPYTHALLRIGNGSDLEAFDVVATDSTKPDIRPRNGFSTPSGFSAGDGIIAVRLGSPLSGQKPSCL